MSERYERIWREKKPVLSKEIVFLLCEISAIKFGDFVLNSGRHSPYYIDLRIIPSYPEVLDKVAELYCEIIENEVRKGIRIDRLAGVPTAGLPIATVVSQKLRIPLIYVREEEKDHGTRRKVEGVMKSGENIIVVDDVITSGGSTTRQAVAIREMGGKVGHVVVLVDRQEGGLRNLEQVGLKLHALVKIADAFNHLKELGVIDDNVYAKVMNCVDTESYGVVLR